MTASDELLCLHRWFATRLVALQHTTGKPLCVVCGAHHLLARASANAPGAVGQGPVVTFNLLRPDDSFFGYRFDSTCCTCLDHAFIGLLV